MRALGQVLLFGLSLVGFLLVFFYFDEIYDSVEISAIGVAGAQIRPATLAGTPENNATAEGGAQDPGSPVGDSKKSSYLELIEQREQSLKIKEESLNQLASELQKQRDELDVKLKELEKMRENISVILKDRVAADEERTQQLVDFYASMKPENAARLIEGLDEGLAVEIMKKMKKANAGNILNMMKVEKAKSLSEKFAGYKAQ